VGVSDEMGGYIAYFEHEADAFGFRLYLINIRMNSVTEAKRYPEMHEGSVGLALNEIQAQKKASK
jgi:hypothetical protein